MLFLAGDRAEILVEDEGRKPFRVVVDESMLVSVDAPIYTADGTLAGQPRLSMRPGESARVEFSMDDEQYVVEIRTKAEYLPGVEAR